MGKTVFKILIMKIYAICNPNNILFFTIHFCTPSLNSFFNYEILSRYGYLVIKFKPVYG